ADAEKEWQIPHVKRASSMEEAVHDPAVNFVMIFTPNYLHCEAVLEALDAGKQVFSEKPLAITIEETKRIVEKEKETNIRVMTGFVLRYSPIYRKVKELLQSGTFGKIVNISANENRISWGGGASMSADYGWRRFTEKAGPYLLEKCSHDLDLLNWFADSLPVKVAAFCGRDYFIPEYSSLWDKYSHEVYAAIVPEKNRINPFTSPKNIYDNHTVIMEYPNGIKMNFQLTLANAIEERRMYISCTEGTIIVDSAEGIIKYKRYDEECETILSFSRSGGVHAGGDTVMAQEIMQCVLSGGKDSSASGSANAMGCALVALAADESAKTGKIVPLNP
ncbi:MAG: Gfo/Idh/MocA family oxidoreductase, partial [Lentisphaeria bacterium]|nr:Gfo/Idh/MocA family oxidoreductase [Lentisphaeria bacterium]